MTKSKKIKIATHNDCDGITAAVMLVEGLQLESNEYTIIFPDEFGGVTNEDYCLDMVPNNPNWSGRCFDHHPDHLPKSERNYKLTWGSVPVGVVVYRKFKKTIPKKHWWKAVCSSVGDMEPMSMPLEVLRRFPILLENHPKYNTPRFSLQNYKLLSSPINAAARFGYRKMAFDELLKANSPMDIIDNKHLGEFKIIQKQLKAEIYRKWGTTAAKHDRPRIISNLFKVAVIETEHPVQGLMASSINGSDGITTVVFNRTTGALSIRGDFTEFIKKVFVENGITCGGHSVASGGHIEKPMTIEKAIKFIEGIL